MPRSVGYAASRAALTAAVVVFSLVLATLPALGSSSLVPTNLTRNDTAAVTLSPAYMWTKTEAEAMAVSARGKISLHDGYKTTSAFDRKHQIALVERGCCAVNEYFIFRSSKPALSDPMDADLASLSIKGITIGATDAAVFRRFGKNRSNLVRGNGIVQYRVDWNDHCEMRYTFDIENHVVRGMSARDAC